MGLASNALNYMLDQLGAQITYASLHTDAVGGGSASEVTGGTPPYARKAVTWAAAAAGSKAMNGTLPTWDVPAITVRRIGFFTALTSGTYYGDADITDEVFAAQGTYTLTAASMTLT